LLAALTLAFAVASTAPAEREAVLTPVEVVGRRGFDPQTGAGSSIDVSTAHRTLLSTSELLGREAGVTLRSSGGFLQSVAIRGSASNQVQLYLNGLPLPSSLSGALSPAIIPPEALGRIDVYRGSIPARYARSPLAGAVDLVTREPDNGTTWRAGAGSFGRREGALVTGVRAGAVGALGGGAVHANGGDYPFLDNHGTPGNPADDQVAERRNNDAKAFEAFGVFESPAGAGTLRGHGLATGVNQGIPGFGFAQTNRTRLDQRLAAGAVEYALPLSEWTAETAVFGGELREHFHDPRGELTSADNDLADVSDQGGARVTVSRDGDWFHPQLAVEAEGLRFRTVRRGNELPSYHLQRMSTSASVRMTPGRAVLTTALQGEVNRQAADNESGPGQSLGMAVRTETLPAASLGIAYPLRAVRLLANMGTGFRIPTVQERFGDRGIQIGNPRLRPERGAFGDAGVQWSRATRHAEWSTDVRVFRQDIHDLIAVYQTSPRTASAMNFSDVAASGAEVQAAARLRRLRLSANLTYNRIVNVNPLAAYDGKQLPGRPVWEGAADASFESKYVIPFYTVQAQGDYFLDPVNSEARRVAARVFHDAGLTTTPAEGLRITAVCENLADVRSYDYVGYPLPGRSYSLVVSFHINPLRQVP
jgi:iron complex outermembrane receptor protein